MLAPVTEDVQRATFKEMMARSTTANLGGFVLFGYGFDFYAYDSGNGHERYGFLLRFLGEREIEFVASLWGFSSPLSANAIAAGWARTHSEKGKS